MLRLCNDELGRRGRGLIEVVLGHPIYEVSGGVSLPGADQRHVRLQRRLNHVLPAIALQRLAAFGEWGARARGSQEAAKACATRTNRLRQVPLGQQLHLQRPGLVR